MLIKAWSSITEMFEDEDSNFENYMEAIGHISNLYKFLNTLKLVMPIKKAKFLPSFKGQYVAEKLGIASTSKESEMKYFKIQSPLFLEDETIKRIKLEMSDLCEEIVRQDDVIMFTLY